MGFVVYNLRLQELVTVVQANRPFYEDFVTFLQEAGYASVADFIAEADELRAYEVLLGYLERPAVVPFYDGLLRPYPPAKAKWFFLAWLMRDAATQRLQPLLQHAPGRTSAERKAYLLNEIRRFVAPLFPDPASWRWPAVAEVMLARLEGSRRALKGTLWEQVIRRALQALLEEYGLQLEVGTGQVLLGGETYDVQVRGPQGTVLFPVKTRETMGGGHAQLFTRDIEKAIRLARQRGYQCVPIIIAEQWGGHLDALGTEKVIWVQANPNQVAEVEDKLRAHLEALLPLLAALQ